MNVERLVAVERLTAELQRSVGHGARPERFAGTTNPFRDLVLLPDGCTDEETGKLIRSWLASGISSLSGEYEVWGLKYPAHKLNRAFRLLLKFEGIDDQAPARRASVMGKTVLGIKPVAERVWREQYEPDLLRVLAEHLFDLAQPLEVAA